MRTDARTLACLTLAALLGACHSTTGPFEGSGAITATVNGHAWQADHGPTPLYAWYGQTSSSLVLGGYYENGAGQISSIGVDFDSITGPGTYGLGGLSGGSAEWQVLQQFGVVGSGGASITDSTHLGSVHLMTWDPAHRHAVGTFNFSTTGSLPVTASGFFDVTFAVR